MCVCICTCIIRSSLLCYLGKCVVLDILHLKFVLCIVLYFKLNYTTAVISSLVFSVSIFITAVTMTRLLGLQVSHGLVLLYVHRGELAY